MIFNHYDKFIIELPFKIIKMIKTFFFMHRAKTSLRQLEKKILDEILGNHYDNRIRPSGVNSTNVHNGKRFTFHY